MTVCYRRWRRRRNVNVHKSNSSYLKGTLSNVIVGGPVNSQRSGVYLTPDSAFSKELKKYLLDNPTNGVRVVEVSDSVTVIGVFTLKTGPPDMKDVACSIERDRRSDYFLDVHILYNI